MVKKVARPTKSRSKTGKAQTAAKAEAVKAPAGREKDEYGFIKGTDSSIAAHVLAEGGASRPALYSTIEERIKEAHGGDEASLVTRNGTPKDIPNMVATVVSFMKERGYVPESQWKMVKDPNWTEPEEKPAKEKKAKPSKKAPAKEEAKAPAKKRRTRRPK